MKRLFLPGLFLLILLSNPATAVTCDWDIMNENFSSNGYGWMLNDTTGENCDTRCEWDISGGVLSFACNGTGGGGGGCLIQANDSGTANAVNRSYEFKARWKINKEVDDPPGWSGMSIGAHEVDDVVYDGYQFSLNGHPAYNYTSETANDTWSSWYTFFVRRIAADFVSNFTLDGDQIWNVTPDGVNRYWVQLEDYSSAALNRSEIEVDYWRISSSYCAGTCSVDGDCLTGQFCNEFNNLCEAYNINITATSYPAYVGVVVTGESVQETEDRHVLYVDSSLYSNDSSSVDTWFHYEALLNVSNDYQVIFFDASGNVIGKSNTTSLTFSQCTTDADCREDFGEGFWCRDGECVAESLECYDDDDCSSLQYCDTYTFTYYRQCRDRLNISEPCTHDNMCFEAECVNRTQIVMVCDYETWPDVCYPVGRCEIDSICYGFGICWNESASNFCEEDADCAATEYCTVDTENTSFGSCLTKKEVAWGSCKRDRWCDNTTNNTYNESMSCDDGYCTPDSWGCNWFRLGCPVDQVCNWNITTETGDHTCVNGSLGSDCESDDDCYSGKCVAGVCVESTHECLYNNPDRFGNSNPNRALDGYCNDDNSNESGLWCYTDDLTNTSVAPNSVLPITPDSKCYQTFFIGTPCDYNYQCDSLDCNYSGNSSTKVCKPLDGSGTSGLATVEFIMDNCKRADNNTGWDCPADGRSVIRAKYRDLDNNHISDASYCRAYSSAFKKNSTHSYLYRPLSEGGTNYQSTANFWNNTNINYQVYVECKKIGFGITFSNIDYIYILADNTTRVRWITPSNATTFKAEERVNFEIVLRDLTGVQVSGADCEIELDDSTYSMTNLRDGTYIRENLRLPAVSGGYDYTATCTLSGYVSSDATQTLIVVSDHCFNNKKDADEAGLDCGGTDCEPCETPEDPGDCTNGVYDSCEWGIDCGGCCDSDCVYSSCFNRMQDGDEAGVDCQGWCINHCDTGSCTDGIHNGDEDPNHYDCGGRCYDMGGTLYACPCSTTDECYPYDGSTYCNTTLFAGVGGVCLESECDTDDDCPDVYVKRDGIITPRSRVCDNVTGFCRFGSENYTNGTTAGFQITVLPLSGLPVYNETFVGVCEDGSNGFEVRTNGASDKQYYFIAHPTSPSVPADSTATFIPYTDFAGGEVAEVSRGTIPTLCDTMTGDYIYARIVLLATRESNHERNVEVLNVLTYADAFDVNVTLQGDLGWIANFTVTRAAECFVRNNSGRNWTNISAAASTLHTYNFSHISTKSFFWMCNTTLGEREEGRFNLEVYDVARDLIHNVIEGMIGNKFTWRGWMVIPIFIILTIFIPLLYQSMQKRRQ